MQCVVFAPGERYLSLRNAKYPWSGAKKQSTFFVFTPRRGDLESRSDKVRLERLGFFPRDCCPSHLKLGRSPQRRATLGGEMLGGVLEVALADVGPEGMPPSHLTLRNDK